MKKARVKVAILQLEAEALWGGQATKAIDPLLQSATTLDCMLIEYSKLRPADESDTRQKLLPFVEGNFDANDKFVQEIIAAVEKFE